MRKKMKTMQDVEIAISRLENGLHDISEYFEIKAQMKKHVSLDDLKTIGENRDEHMYAIDSRLEMLEEKMQEMDKRMENIFDRQRDLAIMVLREVKDMFEKNLTK
jgi:DNA-binding transcriptional MerR regulator